jgi:hypothetical protein
MMQGEFKNISVAKADWEAAQNRLERVEARGRPGDNDKRAYLSDQVDERRNVYDTMLQALTHWLASAYDKHSQVFQAAWTAYVLRLEDGKSMLEKHMRHHRSYAKRLEKSVVRMQLGTIDDFDDDTENYASENHH